MKNIKIYQLVLLLTPFVFSFAFGLDIYIPIIPQMTKIFDTSPALIQLTLSLFLLITGLGQVFIGPLSDQWGRKPILFASAIFYALGSLLCGFAESIDVLIVGRVISALGACGMLVTAFALVRDLYSSEESAKMYSFLNGAVGISPTFAPILGGNVASLFGWRSVFYLLSALGLFSFLITKRYISETLPKENRTPLNSSVFRRYLSMIKNPQLLIYSLISGFAESIFFCFFSLSPFIIIDLHGVPTHQFGYYFAVFGSVIAIGGFASGKLVEKFGTQRTIAIGISLMFLGGFMMLIAQNYWGETLSGFLVPMGIACTGAMFLVGCCAAKALEPFASNAGTASAAFGAIQFSLSSVVGTLLMLFPTSSTLPYAISIVLMAIFALLFWKLATSRSSASLSNIIN